MEPIVPVMPLPDAGPGHGLRLALRYLLGHPEVLPQSLGLVAEVARLQVCGRQPVLQGLQLRGLRLVGGDGMESRSVMTIRAPLSERVRESCRGLSEEPLSPSSPAPGSCKAEAGRGVSPLAWAPGWERGR